MGRLQNCAWQCRINGRGQMGMCIGQEVTTRSLGKLSNRNATCESILMSGYVVATTRPPLSLADKGTLFMPLGHLPTVWEFHKVQGSRTQAYPAGRSCVFSSEGSLKRLSRLFWLTWGFLMLQVATQFPAQATTLPGTMWAWLRAPCCCSPHNKKSPEVSELGFRLGKTAKSSSYLSMRRKRVRRLCPWRERQTWSNDRWRPERILSFIPNYYSSQWQTQVAHSWVIVTDLG